MSFNGFFVIAVISELLLNLSLTVLIHSTTFLFSIPNDLIIEILSFTLSTDFLINSDLLFFFKSFNLSSLSDSTGLLEIVSLLSFDFIVLFKTSLSAHLDISCLPLFSLVLTDEFFTFSFFAHLIIQEETLSIIFSHTDNVFHSFFFSFTLFTVSLTLSTMFQAIVLILASDNFFKPYITTITTIK